MIAVSIVVIGLGIVIYHARESRPIPSFPSLAAHPDRSLGGTVAYYATQTGCIRIVAAAGRPAKDVWCLPAEGPSTWVEEGKPVGPQLVWLPDGRLEVTMFRMKPSPDTKTAPPLSAGWQKILDVGTGKIDDVAAADLPSKPNLTTEPTVSPRGERITTRSDGATGQVKVTLTDGASTRTVLSAHGPGEYAYQFSRAFWAPNWQWIAASDDGRILSITPTQPPTTRVLVTGSGGGAGGGTAGPTFAVTSANLLPSSQ
ncbi:MAG: hypothetical protein ACXVJ7_15960 [Acidimicrobiia bacterium]